MMPAEVPAALVEKFANALGLAYVAEQMPEYARNLRLGLAAVVPEIQAQAWEDGYDRAEEDHDGTGFWARGRRGNPHTARLTATTEGPTDG